LLGKKLSHFLLLEEIGRGGMGVVYLAEDLRLRRRVAVKTLLPEVVGDERFRRRMLREARAAAGLNHPAIAVVHAVEEAEDTVFLVMELIEGQTLQQLLEERNRLPANEAVRIAIGIAEGLAAAHAVPLVHRDLKPANIAITTTSSAAPSGRTASGRTAPGRTASGRVKILDFGLAKTYEEDDSPDPSCDDTLSLDITHVGGLVGTLAYMSPEQARGDRLGPRSDLFSLGILLYEMLTGTNPFRRPTPVDTLSAVLNRRPEPVQGVPTELVRLIEALLEKDVEARYPSAERLVGELAALARVLVSRRAPPPSRRQGRLCICGRSAQLPACDGSHQSEDWTCVTPERVPFIFSASERYHNLATKLAAHHRGLTSFADNKNVVGEVLVTIVDGTDLDFVGVDADHIEARRHIVITLGIASEHLGGLFPGTEIVDFSDVDPLHAFRKISAWLARDEAAPLARAAPVLRSAFLSHAVQDEPLILSVKDFLVNYYDANVFTCADSIPPGADWQAKILEALREKEIFVFLLSQASLGSHFCSFELGVASALGRELYVLSLDGSSPPVFIQHIQAIDVARIARTRPWLETGDVLLEELLKVLV
jgi:serine/threonine protein kinase